jgi:hypothetical protein
MNGWEPLDTKNGSIEKEPWEFCWKEWKSGTSEFAKFLHEPKAPLCEQLRSVTADFSVQSSILNHEIGLKSSAVCTSLLVDLRKKISYVVLYKH